MPRLRRLAFAALAASVAVLAIAPPALAHFEIKPRRGDPSVPKAFTFSIENEQSNASTVRFDVQLPVGVKYLGAQSLGGWTLQRQASQGALRTLSFRARRPLGPGQATQDWVVSLRLPATPGATLSFKGVQTYDNGEKVRWIGPPGSDEPAPTVRVSTRNATKKPITGATTATGPTGPDEAHAGDPGGSGGDDDDDGGLGGLEIALLIVAGVAALGGVAYLIIRSNRRRGT